MVLKESFRSSLRKHLAFRKSQQELPPQPYEPGPPLTAAELLPPILESNDPRVILADSIDQLNNNKQLASPIQLEQVRKIVIEDAENLAAHLLPPEVAEALELKTHKEIQDTTTTLPALFLLAEASDATDDEKLADAIDYLLTANPPHHSNELQKAFLAARKNHTPIMQEFLFIKAQGDDKDDTPTPEQREVALGARRATPPQNQHLYRNASGYDDIDHTMA